LYILKYGRNGGNISFGEVPVYIMAFTFIVGAALRKIEIMHRTDLNRQRSEEYLKDKFINVL